MRRRATIVAALAFALVAQGAPPAGAASYTNPSILSVAPNAQFDVADSPVVSADGQYVVFRGTVNGQTGLWRRDQSTGSIVPVAVNLPGVTAAVDPQAPSVSADGRYIAFDTRAQLDPVNDTNTAWDVYVRDMNIAPGSPGAYTLASAVDHGTQAVTYQITNPLTDGARIAGAQQNSAGGDSTPTAPGGAITADGRAVVFSVNVPSNLPGTATIGTPASEVAVRNLNTDTTTVVSTDASTGQPVNASSPNSGPLPAVGNDDAVISADGTTVAWISPLAAIALEAPSQFMPGEGNLFSGGQVTDGLAEYEAVSRRIADGPNAPIRRVSGDVDPQAPTCPPGSTVNLTIPAGCAGPLDSFNFGSNFSHLALSGDGYTVLFLSQAALRGGQNGGINDAYLVDMHPGKTLTQALAPLTQAATAAGNVVPGEAPIVSDAISADGSTILLSTARTRFDLTSPRYIGPPRATTAAGNELYVINRAQGTLDLITYAYNQTFADYPNGCVGGTFSPSLSTDGSQALFDSCSDNLVFGDGNGASDVFSASALGAISSTAPAQQPGVLPSLWPPVVWRLIVTTQRLPGGAVELDVVVPGAGRVSAQATGQLAVASRKGHRRIPRTVAAASASSGSSGLLTLRLMLTPRYQGLARHKALPVVVRVTFRSRGGAKLVSTATVSFRLPSPAPRRGTRGSKR